MLHFYKSDPHINKDLEWISDKLIELVSIGGDFRNRVSHSVKLLVKDDDNFSLDLQRLSLIWKTGKTAFENFIDPKVRHSSPIT